MSNDSVVTEPNYEAWTMERYRNAVAGLLRLRNAYLIALIGVSVIGALLYWTAPYWTPGTGITWYTAGDFWWVPLVWTASVPVFIVAAWGYFTGLPRTLLFQPLAPAKRKTCDVVFAVTTLGTSPKTVSNTIASVFYWTKRHPEVAYRTQVWVVTEKKGYDLNKDDYEAMRSSGAQVYVVPPDLTTPNGSIQKTRALWYQTQLRREQFDDLKKVWVFHHDDETAIGEDTVLGIDEFVRIHADERAVGYGVILYDQHFSWRPAQVQELTRTNSDLSNLTFVSQPKNVMGMYHGSHYICRADLEDDWGWDVGTGPNGRYISEDLTFDVEVRALGGKVERLHGIVHEMAPLSISDQLNQRRRWCQEAWAVYYAGRAPLARTVVATYCYINWFFGGFSAGLLVFTLWVHIGTIFAATFVGFVWISMLSGYHRSWQLHKAYVDHRWTATAVTKGLLGALVDGIAPWYAILTKKRKSFDLVQKDL